ncbi:MAG: cyclic nucleotide-binding domain-containing protein [Vicinamibacteria bacterium]|jgi:hypothetical protein|nr:cyclic nucleotide-binding domain-containing protein [Vicinamibacteria bacterium]
MSDIQDLITRRQYPKALEVIKAELARRPKDQRLRLQHADVLIAANRGREAVPVLLGLADEHASDGFTAKAIAILKRIDKLEPGRRDVEERMSHLVQQKVAAAPSAPARPSGLPEFGFEEIDSSAPELDLGMGGGGGFAVPAPMPEPAVDEGLEFVNPEPDEEEPRPQAVTSPLFESLSPSEMEAVVRGLELLEFQPGDILVAEGAPGSSMFILSTGLLKVYVRDMKGNYLKVKEFAEGEFFGEISVLTGKPRTATIVAATPVEVLELDKKTLDTITQQHPRVREILEEFQKKRAQDTVQQIIKNR